MGFDATQLQLPRYTQKKAKPHYIVMGCNAKKWDQVKTIFGGKLSSRNFDNQAVELFIKCAALNRMIQIAKPDSYEVDA